MSNEREYSIRVGAKKPERSPTTPARVTRDSAGRILLRLAGRAYPLTAAHAKRLARELAAAAEDRL
jgi:hypothetical protein